MVKLLTKNRCVVEGTMEWALRAQAAGDGYIINDDGTKFEIKKTKEEAKVEKEEKIKAEVKKKKDISKGFKNAKKK